MKALTFHGPGRVRYESVPDPSILEPGDALVRVTLTAVCGSDLHPYRGDEKGLDPGTVLGHEFVGELVEVGPGVAALRPGDGVVSPFSTSCGGCFYCRRGLTSRCETGELFGWVEGGFGLDGGQAELVRVPLADSTLLRLPEGVTNEAALLAGDVLSTGFFCAEMAAIEPGDLVAVVGCGPVGLMAVLAARSLGAERVVAVDTVPERLRLAEELGAAAVDARSDAPAEVVRQATEGRGADAVLEAVGSPEATRLAIDLVRPGGTVAAAGFHTEASFAFGPGEAYDKNLTYRAGRCPARRYLERLLPRLATGRLQPERIISHRLSLADGPRAYDLFDRKLESCVKVVLRP